MNAPQSIADTGCLPPLPLPEACNYIAAFLTLRCNLRCPYCINRFGDLNSSGPLLAAGAWLTGLNRLQTKSDLPITLQGGEPSLHPGFYEIINGLRPDLHIDLLTNLQFDVDEFMARVPPTRLKRDAPYASIRVSYHPETMDLPVVQAKILKMLTAGYSVGIWAVAHPANIRQVELAEASCRAAGIDFRRKDFLGIHQGVMYGHYTYEGAVDSTSTLQVECRTSELLIGPAGDLYRCHSDLYAARDSYGSILEAGLAIDDKFRPCSRYGACNPCDVKTKTDRFQQSGHTSVEIRFSPELAAGEGGGV
ncbi:MAG: radical SAM protein [Desulfobulbaceae bacterium]|nr:radical SAM protein [Desulfobulbaceae bacterium]